MFRKTATAGQKLYYLENIYQNARLLYQDYPSLSVRQALASCGLTALGICHYLQLAGFNQLQANALNPPEAWWPSFNGKKAFWQKLQPLLQASQKNLLTGQELSEKQIRQCLKELGLRRRYQQNRRLKGLGRLALKRALIQDLDNFWLS